jgi:hypothetical protein
VAVLRISRRRLRLLAVAAVLAVFSAVLVGWVSGPKAKAPKLSPGGQRALAIGSPDPASSSPSPSGSTSARGAKAAKGAKRSSAGDLLPALPQSTDVSAAGQPARAVRMTLRSDAAIVQMGYLVRGGHPAKYLEKNVGSPAVITTTAYGYGLVAEIGAQASPYATYLTCTVTVDGHLHSQHTVKGAWAVAVCIG